MELVGMGAQLVFWADHSLYEGLLLRTIKQQAQMRGIETFDIPNIRNLLSNSGDHSRFNEKGFNEAFCITAITKGDIDVLERYLGDNPLSDVSGVDLGVLERIVAELPVFRHYHKPTDKSKYLSEKTLQMVSDLVWNSILEIDKKFWEI